jgi:hypothetical protein
VLAIKPAPSVALGMMLVAACPGGNISNFLTHYARGNTALSITMTAVSTAVAIVMTPLNLSLWGGLNPETSEDPQGRGARPAGHAAGGVPAARPADGRGHVGRPPLPASSHACTSR